MKTIKNIQAVIVFLLGVFLLNSCKKNDSIPIKDVVYTVSSNSYDVTFNNKTTDAKSYKWNFGDSTTSVETSPTHTYKRKGKFVVTLYATLNNGSQISGSTIVNVSKSSPIKLDDNSLADWDTISTQFTPTGKFGGIVKTAKVDYDSNNIYLYMEMNAHVADGNIFDFYMDTDNSSLTGLLTGAFPGGGYDYLLEGPVLSQANGLVQYQHTGAQANFSFNQVDVPEFYKVGTVQEANGVVKFEMALVRSKIGGLTGPALTFGIIVNDNNYSALGYLPGQNLNAITLNISQ
jgi:hypothetical protein